MCIVTCICQSIFHACVHQHLFSGLEHWIPVQTLGIPLQTFGIVTVHQVGFVSGGFDTGGGQFVQALTITGATLERGLEGLGIYK